MKLSDPEIRDIIAPMLEDGYSSQLDMCRAVAEAAVQAERITAAHWKQIAEGLQAALDARQRRDAVQAEREGAVPVALSNAKPIDKPAPPQASATVPEGMLYETIVQWDQGGGKRSRRELARRISALLNSCSPAAQHADASPVHVGESANSERVAVPEGMCLVRVEPITGSNYAQGLWPRRKL